MKMKLLLVLILPFFITLRGMNPGLEELGEGKDKSSYQINQDFIKKISAHVSDVEDTNNHNQQESFPFITMDGHGVSLSYKELELCKALHDIVAHNHDENLQDNAPLLLPTITHDVFKQLRCCLQFLIAGKESELKKYLEQCDIHTVAEITKAADFVHCQPLINNCLDYITNHLVKTSKRQSFRATQELLQELKLNNELLYELAKKTISEQPITNIAYHITKPSSQSVIDGKKTAQFNPEGTMLASCSTDFMDFDDTIQLQDIQTGQRLHILKGHTSSVHTRSLQFNQKGTLLASCSNDKTIRLWDMQTGQCSRILEGHTDYVTSVQFNSEGTLLASYSNDNTIRLWDIQTGQCLHTLKGQNGETRYTSLINSVKFNPEGTMLASCCDDHTIRLWDIQTGRCVHTLRGTHFIWDIKDSFFIRRNFRTYIMNIIDEELNAALNNCFSALLFASIAQWCSITTQQPVALESQLLEKLPRFLQKRLLEKGIIKEITSQTWFGTLTKTLNAFNVFCSSTRNTAPE